MLGYAAVHPSPAPDQVPTCTPTPVELVPAGAAPPPVRDLNPPGKMMPPPPPARTLDMQPEGKVAPTHDLQPAGKPMAPPPLKRE